MEHHHVKDIWNADLYDGNHSFVSKFGSHLLELLSPVEEEQILDIGCGTGDLAHKIYQHGAHVTGVDKSENMVHQANIKYPDVTFIAKDVLELEYNNSFDAVFSNATLHWVKQPEETLQHIYNSLKSGGRFVAEFGGKDNVQIITNEIILQIKKSRNSLYTRPIPLVLPKHRRVHNLDGENRIPCDICPTFRPADTFRRRDGIAELDENVLWKYLRKPAGSYTRACNDTRRK